MRLLRRYSSGIVRWWEDDTTTYPRIDKEYLYRSCGEYWPIKNWLVWSVPMILSGTSEQTTNNRLIVYDLNLGGWLPPFTLALSALCLGYDYSTGATGKIGLGLVQGFSFARHGALGSSVAHDSHNLIVAGTNPQDMLVCVQTLVRSGGGFVAAADGQVLAELPLPIAGLMSTSDVHTVRHQLQHLHAAAQSLGCHLPSPFATLSFLPLPVIPELRITPRGLFDVGKQQFIATASR